jgi:hypothetical protein
MILDGIDIGIGNVKISDSNATIDGVKIKTNRIDISSKDDIYFITFWTIQECEKFNSLELNKKTSILNLIDSYDIDFSSNEYNTINSKENTDVYFTRIDNNKYIINVEIKDLTKCIIGYMKDHNNLKLETIIDFNKIK